MKASLIPKERLELLAKLALRVHLLPGAAAEVGVFRGGSAEVLAKVMPGRPFHLFDTFKGLPYPHSIDGAACRPGRFIGSVQEVQRRVPAGIIHMGKLHADSSVPPGPYAFVHIDVDLFASTFDALLLFYPLVLPGGIIVVDDYDGPHTPGATRAVDMFMRNAPEELVRPPEGGCWLKRVTC